MIKSEYPVFIKDYIYGIKEFLLPLGLAGINTSVGIQNRAISIQVNDLTKLFWISYVATKTLSDILYEFSCSYTFRRVSGDPEIPYLYFERYKEEYNRERKKTCAK